MSLHYQASGVAFKLPSPGDVVYLHVLGQSIVILNTPEAAGDLLDKRGSIYSDKPSFVMVGELCVFPFVSFAMSMVSTFRQMRLQKHGKCSNVHN